MLLRHALCSIFHASIVSVLAHHAYYVSLNAPFVLLARSASLSYSHIIFVIHFLRKVCLDPKSAHVRTIVQKRHFELILMIDSVYKKTYVSIKLHKFFH